MKKGLALVLAFTLILVTLMGCDKKDSDSDISSDALNKLEDIFASDDTNTSDESNIPDDPNVPDEPSAPDEPNSSEEFNIQFGTNFSDGVAFIYYLDENEVYKTAAIDKTGNILFEPDDNFDMSHGYCYKNGIMVIDNLIYDKTGKIIASPEITGYDELMTKNCNGFVIAVKTEESFSGDKYCVGVLDNKGQWKYPLSSENPIAKEYEKQLTEYEGIPGRSSIYVSEYISDTVVKIEFPNWDDYYYNIATNELTNGYIHYEYRNYQGEDAGIYQYDSSGNYSLILKDITDYTFFEDAFIGAALIEDENGYSESSYKIYDYNGNVLTDLSDYKLASFWSGYGSGSYYVNEHLLVSVNNDTSSNYLCLINKAGEIAFEPIKMEHGDDFYPLDETGFVYVTDNANKYSTYTHYDFSGNTIEYTDVIDFRGFHEGLAIVQNSDGQCYYMNVNGKKVIS